MNKHSTNDIQLGVIQRMKVYYYIAASGRSPVTDYIDGLPESDQARFFEVSAEIEKHGLEAARIIFKPLQGKLWEIKFTAVGGGYCILYAIITKDSMVWLHAFKRKTQKTPPKELELALKRLKEVIS